MNVRPKGSLTNKLRFVGGVGQEFFDLSTKVLVIKCLTIVGRLKIVQNLRDVISRRPKYKLNMVGLIVADSDFSEINIHELLYMRLFPDLSF